MKPLEYEKNVLITESVDFASITERVSNDRMIRLLHAGLGLSSELSEIVEAISLDGATDWVNVMEESADLLWYVAVAVNALGLDHEKISAYETSDGFSQNLWKKTAESAFETLNVIVWSVGTYNDLLKKSLFYGRELNMDKLTETLTQLCCAISGLCYVSGHTIEEARERNIAKLKARYGDKFTAAAALNRDLETERAILEGSNEEK